MSNKRKLRIFTFETQEPERSALKFHFNSCPMTTKAFTLFYHITITYGIVFLAILAEKHVIHTGAFGVRALC